MKTPKKILVVISGKHTKHAALERALEFAEQGKLHIHIFNSIYEPVMELTDVLSSDHRKELKKQYLADRQMYLDSLAESIKQKGIKCSTHLRWHRNLDEAIEQVADELQPDLVIKRISADADSINPFAMPIDRYLLRHCCAPLLLVNDESWTSKPILAAIDPCTTDSDHINLNHQVIEAAEMVGKLVNADVHAVNAYMTPNINFPYDIPDLDYSTFKKNAEKFHLTKMHSFLEKHKLSDDRIHLVEGEPDGAIKKVSDTLSAQLVVIGTVGRTGIMGSLIGNTADDILSKLTGEVLAVRPVKSK